MAYYGNPRPDEAEWPSISTCSPSGVEIERFTTQVQAEVLPTYRCAYCGKERAIKSKAEACFGCGGQDWR